MPMSDERHLSRSDGQIERVAIQTFVTELRTLEVHQMSHLQASGQVLQLLPAGHEETAERSAILELVHPELPALGITANPLKNAGQLCRYPGFAFAKEPPSIVHQKEKVADRESLEHARPGNESNRRRSSIGQSQ